MFSSEFGKKSINLWYSSKLRLIFMIVSNHGWDNDCSRAENNKGWYRISSPADRSQSMLESLPAFPRAMPSVELARRLGENMKYLIFDRKHNPLIYILFGSAAWKCAPGMTLSAGMRLQGKQISNSWPTTCGFWFCPGSGFRTRQRHLPLPADQNISGGPQKAGRRAERTTGGRW